jgi:hypothetical protein
MRRSARSRKSMILSRPKRNWRRKEMLPID